MPWASAGRCHAVSVGREDTRHASRFGSRRRARRGPDAGHCRLYYGNDQVRWGLPISGASYRLEAMRRRSAATSSFAPSGLRRPYCLTGSRRNMSGLIPMYSRSVFLSCYGEVCTDK